LGITTNGITLSKHLDQLIAAGLTHVNISLDTLQEKKFEEITRRKGFSHVLQSISDACTKLPSGRVKINCVVMRGINDDELERFIDFARDLPIDVRFIEWMPFNENGWNRNRFISYKDMLTALSSANLQRISDSPNDTTKWYRASDNQGRVGFITSMSQHFCGTCNRLRVTADGQLKVCLFGSNEVSLRDALRSNVSDDDLMYIVWAALQNKHFALGGHGSADGISLANDNRPMILIGG
jgi:cyclic pyranopterin phosphate synthase